MDPKTVLDERPSKQHGEIVKNHLDILYKDADTDDILFQHSALCQTFLPYRKPKNDNDAYVKKQGNLTTILTPHKIENSEGNFFNVGLPYGPKARLLLYMANTLALQRQDPKIMVGRDMAEFLRNMNLNGSTGRYNMQLKEQLIRLKKTSISFHFKGDNHSIMTDRFIFTTIVFPKYKWNDSLSDIIHVNSDIGGIWLELDHQYYENLQAHAIPMDERGIKICARNARALDIYSWLVMRLQKIKNPNIGDFVAWKNLWDQFGNDVSNFKYFKREFLSSLELALMAYPDAKIDYLEGKGFRLWPSKPAIRSKLYKVS
jgi:hypothetical protein